MFQEVRDWFTLLITALSSGGIVYLVTYFFKGKRDLAEEEKTIIGYLKKSINKLDRENKKTKKRLLCLEKKYLDLEIKFELTEFEKKIYLTWIMEQPDGEAFLEEIQKDINSKKEFLEKIRKFRKINMDTTIINIALVVFFVSFFLLLFYFGYTYTIDKLAETANLELELEILKNK